MSKLYFMVSIIDRSLTKRFSSFYEAEGLSVSVTTLGVGTAASEILDYFGLDGAEKSVIFHVINGDKWRSLKHQLRLKMSLDVPGVGIVFLIPVSSVGGIKTLNYLTAGQEFQKGEESTLKDTKFELLVVIANQGYTELIMDAAREVHATGGTVVHAKGTGIQQAEKFMGVTLVPEKEMLFIVTRKEQKNDIMSAIMQKAGTGSKAGAIVFSLPVTDTAGMRMIEDVDEEMLEI
ncbi:MAG: P-II family nitrogen regulator [Oscillospiraceae bacterium]|nr:P-II family nitrogen regulator [Oscillospiraceae bacterium]